MSISSTFYEIIFHVKVFFCSFSIVTIWLCHFFGKIILAQKLLVKVDILTIGINFINILLEAFMFADLESAKKKTDNLTVCFALLESAGVKVAHRTLMKLTPFL